MRDNAHSAQNMDQHNATCILYSMSNQYSGEVLCEKQCSNVIIIM
jgi:hypothetical protein